MALFSLLCQEEDPFTEELIQAAAADPLLPEPYSADFIASLVSNEQKSFPNLNQTYLHSARADAIEWVSAACSRVGFGSPTVLLAANYLDRCFLSSPSLLLQDDKPWMKQLSAVACLSLAAKVEETYVPDLVDLQISPCAEDIAGYVFEPKTVKRMELLVLSTLSWKMNPVTALSFAHCIVSKLEFVHDPMEILRRCEAILLSLVADSRWVMFPPSVWASAALLQSNVAVFDDHRQLMEMLEISKETVEECRGLIAEVMGNRDNKRKSCHYYCNDPPSPNGVISSCFSYESSSSSLDSWAMWPSSVSSSPEPPPPAKRAHFE